MEIWAKIKSFENYMVSNKGHVKSLNYNNTGKEQILKPKINKHNGILEVTLSKNNKKYYRTVCRLVLETFLNIKFTKNICGQINLCPYINAVIPFFCTIQRENIKFW